MRVSALVLAMLFAASNVEALKLSADKECGPPGGCGCASAAPAVVKASDSKAASAVRTAERSVKNAVKKLEEKMEAKSDKKDAVKAIEKVKKDQEE
jgi:hypothetical protein